MFFLPEKYLNFLTANITVICVKSRDVMEPQVRLLPPLPSIFYRLIESGLLPFYFGEMQIQCEIVYCHGDLLTLLLP